MLRVATRVADAYLLRLATGSDLLAELERHVRETGIRLGWLSGLGAVSRAGLRYYDQEAKVYRDLVLDRHLELVGLEGNVSLLDGDPFVHAHITLADDAGRAFGGHLGPGTQVFAAEILLTALEGPPLERQPDERTGLKLWRS